MIKIKICVYAICKNEEKFVKRWYDSIKEADGIFVLDTGSTDNTVQALKKLGVVVKKKKIVPWRFDVARNLSLKMIPEDYDVCVCLDLDEVMTPGWYQEIENIWHKNKTTRLRYTYNWSLDNNNNPIISFYSEKIHARNGFKWVNPVHEILKYEGKEDCLVTDNLVVNHYPDTNKSRGSYLPLLELSVKEDPNNDRNMHYLGREYMYYQEWNKAIDTLERHLSMKTATWKDERCASMRFIARSYYNLKRYEEALMWANKSIKESPYLRDGYMEKAIITYAQNDFKETEKLCKQALKIKNPPKTYINEAFTTNLNIYDILSIACYNNKKYKEALKYVNKALMLDNTNERLINNQKLMAQAKMKSANN